MPSVAEYAYLCSAKAGSAIMIRYTRKEEIWNASSHGGGILLGVVFGIIFIV